MYLLYNTMGSSSRRKQKRRFEWNKIYSIPEDKDTLGEVESHYSLTVHSVSERKLRLLNTSSDNSGKAIEDTDSAERHFSYNFFH